MPAVPRTLPEIRRKRTGATLPSKRSPESRSVHGMISRFAVKGRIRGRHYVWAYAGGPAPEEYESSGYRYEKWNFRIKNGKVEVDGNDVPISIGAHPPGARPDGVANKTRIKIGDNHLMSCSAQRKADIDEYGHDGDTGQYFADVVEDRIIKHKGGTDLIRGLGGLQSRHVEVQEYGEHGMEHGQTTNETQL